MKIDPKRAELLRLSGPLTWMLRDGRSVVARLLESDSETITLEVEGVAVPARVPHSDILSIRKADGSPFAPPLYGRTPRRARPKGGRR